MSKIVISGYYGFNNAGDEAVLYSIISALKSLRPDVELTVLSNDPTSTMADHGVKAVNRWNVADIWHALNKADLLISGGGSLLQDVTGSRSVLYYLAIVRFAKLLSKPVIFYANGVGPVRKNVNKFLIAQVANSVDTITVRDTQSLTDLHDMGVTRPLSRVTADPALGIDANKVDIAKGRELLANAGVDLDKPVLGIAIREWEGLEGFTEVIAQVADDLVAEGWQVALVPMHYPKDLEPSKLIVAKMKNSAYVIEQKLLVDDLLSIIGNFNLLVGMRLHALIIAAVMNVPFVGISYDPKVDRFLEITGQANAGEGASLTYEALSKSVRDTVVNRDSIRQDLAQRMVELKEKARESAVLALSLLRVPIRKK